MNCDEHQGFTNRETWIISHLIDNNRNATEELRTNYNTDGKLDPDVFRERVEDMVRGACGMKVAYFGTILRDGLAEAALGRIDWRELCQFFTDKYKEIAAYDDKQGSSQSS